MRRTRQDRRRPGGLATRYATAELAGSAPSGLAFPLPAIAFAAIAGGAWALQRWRRRRV
jgi:hypothetical protein